MEYKIEPIGAQFTKKAIAQLEQRLTSQANVGYKFHSVFQVSQPGCLGIGAPTITYLAIYVKD